MKRINFFKSTAVLFAALLMAACGSKDVNGGGDGNGGGGNGGGNGDDPDPDPPVVVTSAIKIDGDFADWDDLGSKATTIETNENGPFFNDLKIVKLYAEDAFLNFYMEFDKAVLKSSSGGSVVHVFIDADGAQTGYINESDAPNTWFNYHLEGSVTAWDEGANDLISYDPTFWQFDDDAESTWDKSTNLGAGFTTGAGIISGDLVKYEYQVTREMLPLELPSTIRIFFDVQRSWSASGILPIDSEGVGIPYAWNIGTAS